MDLNAAFFLFFFFPFVIILYWIMPGVRRKNLLLAAASLVFYAFGQWQGIVILLLSVLVNYAAGGLLRRGRWKKPVLAVTLILNVALLLYFKYLNLLIGTVNSLLSLSIPALSASAPVGISFFTFKAMSYVIDVYRGGGTGGFSDVLLYISFFPQVSSGPITRFGQFSSRLRERHTDPEQMARGLRRFIVGLGKKLLIAGLVAEVADSAFALGGDAGAALAWLGAIAYTVQLYFDFSGYSDMAIGLGAVFGFVTPENFNYPYIASSLREFWKRWHISLSSWFQDYLYIPLGGGRKGRVRKCLNQFLVFLVSGIWHGANWTFLLWGAWHGVWTVAESCAGDRLKSLQKSLPGRVIGHIYTLLLVCLGFVIFRAASLDNALGMFRAMFTFAAPAAEAVLTLERIGPAVWLALAAGVVGCLPVAPWLAGRADRLKGMSRGCLEVLSYAAAIALFAVCTLAASGGNFQPFIYNQF